MALEVSLNLPDFLLVNFVILIALTVDISDRNVFNIMDFNQENDHGTSTASLNRRVFECACTQIRVHEYR